MTSRNDEACYEAVVDALLPSDPMEPPQGKHEEEWASEIAQRARDRFLRGLDAA